MSLIYKIQLHLYLGLAISGCSSDTETVSKGNISDRTTVIGGGVGSISSPASYAGPSGYSLEYPANSLSNISAPIVYFEELTVGDVIGVYSDASCSNKLAEATASESSLSIELSLVGDGVYNFHAMKFSPSLGMSACSVYSLTYQYDTSIDDISSLTLTNFPQNYGNSDRPYITASGVSPGDSVFLYDADTCLENAQIGFNKSVGSSVDVRVDSGYITGQGSYPIYAKSRDDAGNFSNCTETVFNYIYDTSKPNRPSAVSVDSVANPSQPIISVSGLTVGETVKVYGDADCSTKLGEKVVTSSTDLVQLDTISQDGLYDLHATSTDLALNESNCSLVSASYTLNQYAPSLESVSITTAGGSNLAGMGGEIILRFTASEALKSNSVSLVGNVVTAYNTSGFNYEARHVVSGADTNGLVSFSIDYTDFADVLGSTVSSTSDGSSVTIDKSKNSPAIDQTDVIVTENSPLFIDIDDNSGADTDNSGTPLNYSCVYDKDVDGTVGSGLLCSSLSGFNFNSASGQVSWTPNYESQGDYELKIVASNGETTDEAVFKLTVNDLNRLPVLDDPEDLSLVQGKLLTLDFSDQSTGFDQDVDGDILTYTCEYDDVVDQSVSSGSSCTSITGLNFNDDTGLFSWTVKASNAGSYDFKITADDGKGGIVSVYMAGEVIVELSKLPQLAMVGTNELTYVASLGDDNEVELNGVQLSTYNAGDTFTLTTTKGDVLECSGGCYAITPIDGTAAWSTNLYASTLLTTYMGRYDYAKISVAAFDNGSTISIKQLSGDLVVDQYIPPKSVAEFTFPFTVEETLWIESDYEVSAYVSTAGAGEIGDYNRDGRIITAPATTGLAFVAAAGGTPTGISVTEDGTSFDVYRDDGTNFLNETLNISDFLLVSNPAVSQNGQGSAIAFYSDSPIVSTQHADGDGTNSSPSLSKNMLSTHFVAPMEGDYASFASFEPGKVFVIDENNVLIQAMELDRATGADPKAPYSVSYNPTSGNVDIKPGYRFVSEVPVLGIFETYVDDDETLMTGATLPKWEVASTEFANNGLLPYGTIGSNASICSGTNNFPNLTWSRTPWGVESFAIVVENVNTGDVHLNLVDLPASYTALGPLSGNSGAVAFPAGLVGNNYTGNPTWTGPCLTATMQYKFTVFALSGSIGAAVNNMNAATFESNYSSLIMYKSSMIGVMGFPD